MNTLDMNFNYEIVPYTTIKSGEHKKLDIKKAKIAMLSKFGEKSLCDTMQRICGKETYFSEKILYMEEVCNTITAGGGEIWIENTGTCVNSEEIINAQTFPQDYNFLTEKPRYICGMSVPPIMIKRIVNRLIESGIFDYKIKEKQNEN